MRRVIAALALVSCLAHGDPAAWRVTSDAGGELWLLGSVHYLRESDYPLPPNIDRLHEQSDGLVMEIDFDDLDWELRLHGSAGERQGENGVHG